MQLAQTKGAMEVPSETMVTMTMPAETGDLQGKGD